MFLFQFSFLCTICHCRTVSSISKYDCVLFSKIVSAICLEPLDAVCGNEVVEGAEECDCGWAEDCHEPCCFPMRVNPPQDQPPCRLKPASYCRYHCTLLFITCSLKKIIFNNFKLYLHERRPLYCQ